MAENVGKLLKVEKKPREIEVECTFSYDAFDEDKATIKISEKYSDKLIIGKYYLTPDREYISGVIKLFK